MSKDKLTVKQADFVKAYCEGPTRGNGTQSAREAGYKGNDKTLEVVGSENISKPLVKAAIEERMAQIDREKGVTIEIIRENFLEDRRLSQIAKDRVNMLRADENLAKHVGFFKADNEQGPDQAKIDAVEADEAKRYATWRLRQFNKKEA